MTEGTPIDLDKMRSIGYLGKGRTKSYVKEYKDPVDGHRVKATTDELGNTVSEHNNSQDQVDVNINSPEPVRMGMVRND